MEHDHVVTLFHEFGHLVHHVLGGHVGWTRFAGVATEWDFVEAPSQMLEEWAWDADVLQTFATNAAGEPIPADLVDRMRAADDFGKGLPGPAADVLRRGVLLVPHRAAGRPDRQACVELQERYSPFRYVDDTHFFANFGHLGGYSSAYYTYMWSLVIAKDLFSAFDPDDLFDADGRRAATATGPRPGRHQGRRRPGRRLPRPAVHLRRVRRLAGAVGSRSGIPG